MKRPSKRARASGLRAFQKSVKAKAGKGAGPSKRTPAQRAAIDKRAAEASAINKRVQRATARKSKYAAAFEFACPTCRAQAGVAYCFDRQGREVPTPHRLRVELATKPRPLPLAGALAGLVTETAGNKGRDSWAKPGTEREKIDAQRMKSFGVTHYSPHADLIDPAQILIGKRHREDFGDLEALAQSINDRGGLLQPIALTAKRELIAGERRLRAWGMSRFAGEKIPVHYLDVDAIVRGEWDENAQRKDFTPSEAVKIKRTLESVLAAIEAPASGGGPGRPATGRVNDKIGKLTGVKRESLRKAEAIVEAAEREPERFGDLQAEMDRTGKVNAPHKKLEVRKAREALMAEPPQLPMNGPYSVVVIDYPWPAEGERSQDSIDAADRAWRPYPEMAIRDGCVFMREQVAPLLAAEVTVYFWVTNFHLVRGYHAHLIGALGLADKGVTMLTWPKDKIGRGRSGFRDQTEHVVVLRRGKPLVDGFGADPPSTLLPAWPRGENSQKPRGFYELVQRVTPAKRYAEIFSTGAHGLPDWDCHGDQAGKHAREAEVAAQVHVDAVNMEPGAIVTPMEPAELVAEHECPGHVASDDDPKVCARCGTHIDSLRPDDDPPPVSAVFDVAAERESLTQIAAGVALTREDAPLILARRGLVHAGKETLRLTNLGAARLATLNLRVGTGEGEQIDLEEAIAAKASAVGDDLEIPDFLRRQPAAGVCREAGSKQ